MAPGSTGPRGPLLLVKFWPQDEGDFSTLLNFQADDSLKDEKIDKQREWPRCGVVYCNWTLLNTKLRSSPAYSRKKERMDCTERQCWNIRCVCLAVADGWCIETALRGLSFAFAQSYKPSSPSLAAQIYSSNVSGTGLVITYLNDHPRHRTTNNKGWLNRLQEGRAQPKLYTHNCLDYSMACNSEKVEHHRPSSAPHT